MSDARKLLFYCFCFLLVLASQGLAGNVLKNGTLATDLSGWSIVVQPTGSTPTQVAFEAVEGVPAGCAKCWVDDPNNKTGDTRFGQVLRVNKGQRYKLTGDWKGDLVGLASPENPNSRNWAEIFVGFFDSPPASDQWGTINYKKAWQGGPNTTTGIWDWESIISSPDGTGPYDGVFTATGSYMTIALNVGGRAASVDPAHPAVVYIDNLKLVPCHDDGCSDASADFKYLAWITSNWLGCNIDPVTSCW